MPRFTAVVRSQREKARASSGFYSKLLGLKNISPPALHHCRVSRDRCSHHARDLIHRWWRTTSRAAPAQRERAPFAWTLGQDHVPLGQDAESSGPLQQGPLSVMAGDVFSQAHEHGQMEHDPWAIGGAARHRAQRAQRGPSIRRAAARAQAPELGMTRNPMATQCRNIGARAMARASAAGTRGRRAMHFIDPRGAAVAALTRRRASGGLGARHGGSATWRSAVAALTWRRA